MKLILLMSVLCLSANVCTHTYKQFYYELERLASFECLQIHKKKNKQGHYILLAALVDESIIRYHRTNLPVC